jgi:hypothetical protein
VVSEEPDDGTRSFSKQTNKNLSKRLFFRGKETSKFVVSGSNYWEVLRVVNVNFGKDEEDV